MKKKIAQLLGIVLIMVTSFSLQKEVIAADKVYEFSYTGDVQKFVVPEDGYYQIEAWGANGGKNMINGGYTHEQVALGGVGAYTSGTIYLSKGTTLYIYVGGKGLDGQANTIVAGGYNGGGKGDYDHADDEAAGSGGGATDIRLVGGDWDDFDSLKSRIMVAAGGGGAANTLAGGYGGALIGGSTTYSDGATQTTGYAFGKGMDGVFVDNNTDVGGGGSGYYGGYANSSGGVTVAQAAGAGGSSFVSGCDGCDAIAEESTEGNIIHTGKSVHYSNLKFSDITMLDGSSVTDKPSEDGYATITLLENKMILENVTLENAEIRPKSGFNFFEYNVYLESNSAEFGDFNLEFNIEPLSIIGDKNVSLEIGTKHNITVTNPEGEVIIYTFNFLAQNSNLEDLQFDYLKLEFVSDVYDYEGTVAYNIKNLMPLIKKDDDVTYVIEGNTNLEVGDNTILVKVTKSGYAEEVYTIHVTREEYEPTDSSFQQDFSYTGDVQQFTVPISGYYKIEAWGAAGGRNTVDGGYTAVSVEPGGAGAYTSGTIYLARGTILYIYVGGKGVDGIGQTLAPGGFNGGGRGDHDHSDNEAAGSGGGATDIRLVGGAWNNFDSLKSRIMVAAGGGGAAAYEAGGYGGALEGGSTTYSKGGTQTTGYAFGQGQDGVYVDANVDVGGAGGGYYGGYANSSGASSSYKTPGAGGSSFVSGCDGCNAISSSSTSSSIVHTGQSEHYSGYVFSDITMIAGNENMPSYSSEEEMIGNTEAGYARITLVKGAPELIDLDIEGATIDEPIQSGLFTYHVAIPTDSFETTITAIPQFSNIIMNGDGKVTLKTSQVYNITLMNEEGYVTVYNLIPYIEKAYLEDISFAEVDFDFIPSVYEYELKVDNKVKKLTPTITSPDGITYEIDGDLNLRVGENIIKIIAKKGNDIKKEYIFHVTREFIEIPSQDFSYTGNYQVFVAPASGNYKIEAWGASGGKNMVNSGYTHSSVREGGSGAYTSGTIYLEEGTTLYIYVGGQGTDGKANTIVPGGYNGGGRGDYDHLDDEANGSGGGATDIRLVGGTWDNFESLKSRIMVAAGGGGAASEAAGGYGGALTGGSTPHSEGGTQTTGYAFGKGMDGIYVEYNTPVSGGGSGYYGGFANSSGGSQIQAAGAGGSSFVSGCVGCDAVAEESTESNIIHTGQANHYSDYVFSDITMIAGNAEMPTFDSKDTMTGNTGDGHARITYLNDGEDVKLTSLTVSKGTLDPAFNSDIYEYTVKLDPIDTEVTVNAVANNYDALVGGTGKVTISNGTTDHNVTITQKNGEVITYQIHFIREINSYDRLDDILVNGISIPDFSPDVYEYDVEVPYIFDLVNISAIKNNEFQKVTNDGIFILDSNDISTGIVVVSEDGAHDKVYTVNIHREKTSLLKGITFNTPGVEALSFNPNTFEYELELNTSILQLDLTANPYYRGAEIIIEGNQFVEDKITITSHVDGVEDSTYTINIKRTDDAHYDIDYNLTGKTENFIAPYSGYYRVSLWGAAGGYGMTNGKLVYPGGEGAYTAGTILLKQGEELYINVGGKGNDAGTGETKFAGAAGGYNGGGNGGNDANQDSQPEPGGGGGGATDIRVLNGAWNSEISLRSRIMVASGASAGSYYDAGVDAGGLNGYPGSRSSAYASQIAGYAYGYGANGTSVTCGISGGGSGYYGGYALGNTCYSSGTGSSYISGHAGSIGTNEAGSPNVQTYTKIEDSYNYSGKYFTDTIMIDGSGYLWTDKKEQLELMPNPEGGYFASGHGNPGDGAANITLLQVLSSNNFLDSLILHVGDKEITLNPEFEPWETEYSIELANDETVLTVDAVAKDENAIITGIGDHEVPPKDSTITVGVTSTDGSVRNYEIHVYREPSNDPTPNDIVIEGMYNYICSISASYCNYTFDPQVEEYNITIPFSISSLELIPELKTDYQQVVYYAYIDGSFEEIENVDDEGNQKDSWAVNLAPGLNQFIIEVFAENEEDSILYSYNITRDPTGNANVSNIEIIKPEIEFAFAPLIYEYYITLGEDYEDDEVLFNVVPELDSADVQIRGNTNLVQGMNDCYIVITAPNGETKTYVFHIYKETNSSVYLKNLEVKNGDETYELSPNFDKTVNDYLVNVTNTDNLEIIAEAENSNAQVQIDKPDTFTSGITQVKITVSNGGAENIYYLNVVRTKSSNANLASLELVEYNGTEKYEYSPEFDPDVVDYYLTIPKSIRKVTVNTTPEVSTTTCKAKGHTALINNTGTITITCTAEDNTEKQYHVYVSKDVSDNNKLKDINISTGDDIGLLTPEFNPDIYDYEVTVEENVDRIYVQGILEDSSARIEGNGYYALEKGDNTIELVVTSELGSEATYTIVVHKKLSDDVSIKEIKNDQNSEVSVISDSSLNYHYLINVQYEVKRINIEAIPNNSTAKVSGNGDYNLNVGDNEILITVTSESGNVGNYTVKVIRDLSHNDDLAYLFAHEGALNPRFNETTVYYEVYVANDVTQLTLDVETEDENATYDIVGNENFSEGSNEVKVIVTAQSGNKKEYVLNVIRQEATEDELALKSLTVSEGELDPPFDSNTDVYYVTVPNEITSIYIQGEALSSEDIVSGNGTYNLNVGKNALAITVSNPEGIRRDYQVVVTREKSDDATLQSFVISGHTYTPTFDKEITEYYVNTSNDSLQFTSIIPTKEEATYEIIGNEDLITGSIVTIRVTSPSGNVTKDYNLNITRNPSSNNNLANLEVVGETLIPTFHKGIQVYTLTVGNEINSVLINATPEDDNAEVEGTGLHNLNVGLNEISVTVTSEAGTQKKYTMIITREGNDNNYLQDLLVGEEELTPSFQKKVYEYVVTVPYETEEIEVYGEAEVSTSLVDGNGSYDLEVGVNTIRIGVTSELGSTRYYEIRITREELNSVDLQSLSVKGYELNMEFDPDYYEYYINVPNEIQSIILSDIIAVPVDPTAQVTITGNEPDGGFQIGMNEIIIKVTSTKTEDLSQEYHLFVNRQLSGNNKLVSLTVSEGTLAPNFSSDIMSYEVNVDYSVTEIEINAIAQDGATIVSGVGKHSLLVGDNKIIVKVRSMLGVERDYIITVNREASTNNNLSSLQVLNGYEVLDLTPEFNPNELNYTLEVDSSIQYVNITATLEDNRASISGTGIKQLTEEVNEFQVVVTSESKETKTYTITITRTKSSNNNVLSITPSVGSFTEEFAPEVEEYTLNVTDNDLFLSFDVELEDNLATVRGHENAVIPNGTSMRIIEIIAEDGSTREYTITVIKENTSEARLESLSIDGYEFAFDSNTFTYNIQVSASKKKLLESEITAIPMDDKATVNLMGDFTLEEDIVNVYIIEVIAKDGYTTQQYRLNITRDSEEYTLSSDIYDIIRTDEDYVIGAIQSTDLTTFKANFNNEQEMLHVYDSEGVTEVEDPTSYAGTGLILKLERDGYVYDQVRVIVRADLTGDGRINVTDQVRLINYVGKVGELNADEMLAADLTGDGIVNVLDQVRIINYIGRLIGDGDLNP